MKRVKGEVCALSDLKVGQCCRINELRINNLELKIHLLEMGLVPDSIIKIKKTAPLGDPVVIFLRGYEIFLAKSELKKIIVTVI